MLVKFGALTECDEKLNQRKRVNVNKRYKKAKTRDGGATSGALEGAT